MNKTVDAMKKLNKTQLKLTCLESLIVELGQTITPLDKIITRNWLTGTEQPDKILLSTTEIGGSVSIANTLRTDTENHKDPNIQPTTIHIKQSSRPRHSERNHFHIGSLNSGIDVPRYGWNIDNRTEMNPQRPIITTISESNISNNSGIFDSVSKTLDLAYRPPLWHIIMKNETENLVENLRDKNILKYTERAYTYEIEKLGPDVNGITPTRL